MSAATMKHTPGPWERCGLYIRGPLTDGGYLIAEVAGSGDEARANGDLIAAAPKLLAAAKALAACDFGSAGWCNEAESAALRLRAAIAEATGGAE